MLNFDSENKIFYAFWYLIWYKLRKFLKFLVNNFWDYNIDLLKEITSMSRKSLQSWRNHFNQAKSFRIEQFVTL